MTYEFERINEMIATPSPKYAALRVKVDQSENQMYEAFIEIWEHVGDEAFIRWFKQDGYRLTKRNKRVQ